MCSQHLVRYKQCNICTILVLNIISNSRNCSCKRWDNTHLGSNTQVEGQDFHYGWSKIYVTGFTLHLFIHAEIPLWKSSVEWFYINQYYFFISELLFHLIILEMFLGLHVIWCCVMCTRKKSLVNGIGPGEKM